jgi:hypothetical protein
MLCIGSGRTGEAGDERQARDEWQEVVKFHQMDGVLRVVAGISRFESVVKETRGVRAFFLEPKSGAPSPAIGYLPVACVAT